jgi:precorrin-6B methylase 2
MPSPTIEYAQDAQDKTLSALRQSQTAVLDVVETWAKAVEKSVDDLPAIPVAGSLPSAEEIIKTSYDFAGKVLEAQREFAQKLVTAAAPAVKTTKVATPAK